MNKLLMTVSSVLLLAACVVSGVISPGRRPMEGLTAGEIAAATVHCAPPDASCSLNREEIEELIPLLQKAAVYGPDSSYGQYAGQMVTFTLTKTGGSVLTIQVYSPFLILNGVGYQAEYGPCEALNQFANRLIDSSFAVKAYILRVNGAQLDTEELPKGPYEENGALMVPLRAVCEALGYQVAADLDAGIVTVEDSIQKAVLQAGSAEVVFEGKLQVINLSRTVMNPAETAFLGDEFYLPLEFFQEFFLDTAIEGDVITVEPQVYELGEVPSHYRKSNS